MTRQITIALTLIAALAASAQGQTVLYVDGNSPHDGPGNDWQHAYHFLQDALSVAVSGDEIRVAAGTYRPDARTANPTGTGDTTATFQLASGVSIFGGYAGFRAANPDERDVAFWVTLLSGDLFDNDRATDFPGGPSYAENCYHIVTGNGVDTTAVLDGFYIEGGHAHGSDPHDRGGGIYSTNGEPTISNCTVVGNSASLYGGGMYNNSSAPTLDECAFDGNSSDSFGGAIVNQGSNPEIVDCAFTGNRALGLHGGAIYNWMGSSPHVLNSRFTGNNAGANGGGMSSASGSPVIANCIFSENSAAHGGGIHNEAPDSTVVNCTFAGNTATEAGGAVESLSDAATFANCIFWGNDAPSGRQVTGSVTVTYSCVQDEDPDDFAIHPGPGNIDDDPLLVGYGDMHLQSGSPCCNTGSNGAVPADITIDFEGDERIMHCRVDMGVDETTYFMDYNGNGVHDACEDVLYVDDDASPGGDGLSWDSAFDDLQVALSTTQDFPVSMEIRVATGTYYPSQRYEPETPRTETFQLINGVTLLGGYAGLANPTNPNDRNLLLYETIISGDLGLEGDDSDNCIHVFYHTENLQLDSTAVLDGFTITGGKADGVGLHVTGGGMFNYAASPTVRNCTFSGNWGIGGGGIANLFSDPTVVNCTFSRNSANPVDSRIAQGGAVYNAASSPALENCTFHANLASGAGSRGGGMANASDSAPLVTNCRFIGNEADLGGGVFNGVDCNPTMVNCVFSGNSAVSGGGIFNGAASPTVTNSTFGGNTSIDDGGAMYNADGGTSETSDPVITNCIMWGNTALSGPQIFSESGSSPTITYSCIQHGWSGTGNIGGLPEHNPLYSDADGPDNMPGTEDDSLHLLPGSPCINTGSNAVPNLPETDLDSHVRVLCDTVDMGAYEFGIGDYECDEDVDLNDFATWEACMTGPDAGPYPPSCETFDFEYDGDVDLRDLASFQAIFEGQP